MPINRSCSSGVNWFGMRMCLMDASTSPAMSPLQGRLEASRDMTFRRRTPGRRAYFGPYLALPQLQQGWNTGPQAGTAGLTPASRSNKLWHFQVPPLLSTERSANCNASGTFDFHTSCIVPPEPPPPTSIYSKLILSTRSTVHHSIHGRTRRKGTTHRCSVPPAKGGSRRAAGCIADG